VEAASKESQRFERLVVSRDEALAMFQENKFKVRLRARTADPGWMQSGQGCG
jgi:threonyl-tRNA synthetase